MTYEKLKNDAAVMVIASKTLEVMAVTGLNTCEDAKMGEFLAHIISPALILRAFSCELILKSLIVKATEDTGNSHRLNDLYHKVDTLTKDAIAGAVIRKMQEHNTRYGSTEFLSDLDNLTEVSMDWRSLYEDPRSLNTNFLEQFFHVLVKYTLPE